MSKSMIGLLKREVLQFYLKKKLYLSPHITYNICYYFQRWFLTSSYENKPEDPAFSTGGRLIFKRRYLCIIVTNNLV
jgi:hypothetical protein